MKKYLTILSAFLLVGFMTGCMSTGGVDNVTKVSYQVLHTSKTVYDTVTDSINDLYKAGLISSAVYMDIEEYADNYMEAHNIAVDTVKAFKMGYVTAGDASNKVVAVTAALTALLNAAQPHILANGG